MDNIKLLPLQDGTLGVISRRTAVKIDQGAVKQLTSMGFPYSIVWVALNKHNNDVVASSTWLLQMQQCQDNEKSRKSIFPDEVWDVVPYYVCSDIERELLVGQVQRAMVNIEICPTHVKQILRSKSFQEKVNVNVMTPQVMSYLIVDTLPPRGEIYHLWIGIIRIHMMKTHQYIHQPLNGLRVYGNICLCIQSQI